MSTHQPRHAITASRPRHRISRWPIVLVVGLAVILGLSSGGTLALWSSRHTSPNISITPALLGFAVEKENAAAVHSTHGEPISTTLGRAEAEQMIVAGPDNSGVFTLALRFSVAFTASHGFALDYTMNIEGLDSDSILGLGGATPQFFEVDDPSSCTVGGVSGSSPYLVGTLIEGIEQGFEQATSDTHHWCLVFSITPQTYHNTATASGTNVVGTQENSTTNPRDTWMTYLTADLELEPNITLTFTPMINRGNP